MSYLMRLTGEVVRTLFRSCRYIRRAPLLLLLPPAGGHHLLNVPGLSSRTRILSRAQVRRRNHLFPDNTPPNSRNQRPSPQKVASSSRFLLLESGSLGPCWLTDGTDGLMRCRFASVLSEAELENVVRLFHAGTIRTDFESQRAVPAESQTHFNSMSFSESSLCITTLRVATTDELIKPVVRIQSQVLDHDTTLGIGTESHELGEKIQSGAICNRPLRVLLECVLHCLVNEQ